MRLEPLMVVGVPQSDSVSTLSTIPLSPELGCDVANTTGGGPRPTTLPVGAAEHTSIPTPFWWHPGGGQARSQTQKVPLQAYPEGGKQGWGHNNQKGRPGTRRRKKVGEQNQTRPPCRRTATPRPRTPRHLWSLSFLYTQCNHPHWSAKEA